jgi:hypothetical protein
MSRVLMATALAAVTLAVPSHAQQVSPASAPAASAQNATVQAAVAVAGGSKRWIGHETEYEEFIRTAKVDKCEDTEVGVTHPKHCLFAPGSLVSGIVFKPLQPGKIHGFFESYRSEIAAYELDKLLGLHMVPPTVERTLHGDSGSAQMWVDDVVPLKAQDGSSAPDPAAWNRQIYRQRVFDNLVANIDRNQGNLLLDPIWNLILIDHSRAFTAVPTMPFPMTRIDRDFYNKLKGLDEATVKAHLGKLLYYGAKPLLQRRDEIVKVFEDKIAQYGEAAVLTN